MVPTSTFGYLRLRRRACEPSHRARVLALSRIARQPWRDAYVYFKHRQGVRPLRLGLRPRRRGAGPAGRHRHRGDRGARALLPRERADQRDHRQRRDDPGRALRDHPDRRPAAAGPGHGHPLPAPRRPRRLHRHPAERGLPAPAGGRGPPRRHRPPRSRDRRHPVGRRLRHRRRPAGRPGGRSAAGRAHRREHARRHRDPGCGSSVAGGFGLVVVVAARRSCRSASRPHADPAHRRRCAARPWRWPRTRLPRVVARLRGGETVDVEAEAPPLAPAADEIGQLGDAFTAVQRTADRLRGAGGRAARGLNQVFLNIARRSQTLLHRQLALLDAMERRVTDPDELEELFRVDHLATRMRRHAEDLVILAGAAPGRGWRNPVPIVDVLRGAVSEVEDYTRVSVIGVPEVALAGRAVGDVIHLLAELMENATVVLPAAHPGASIAGQLVPNGFAVEIEDRGARHDRRGDRRGQRAAARSRRSSTPRTAPGWACSWWPGSRPGTASRVTLRRSPYGGITAVVLLPPDAGASADRRRRRPSRRRPVAPAGPRRPGRASRTGRGDGADRPGCVGRRPPSDGRRRRDATAARRGAPAPSPPDRAAPAADRRRPAARDAPGEPVAAAAPTSADAGTARGRRERRTAPAPAGRGATERLRAMPHRRSDQGRRDAAACRPTDRPDRRDAYVSHADRAPARLAARRPGRAGPPPSRPCVLSADGLLMGASRS